MISETEGTAKFWQTLSYLVDKRIIKIDYDFKIEEKEVEQLIELPLSDLMRINKLALTKINLTKDVVIKIPAFVFKGKVVWGATALMLNELRWILKGHSF